MNPFNNDIRKMTNFVDVSADRTIIISDRYYNEHTVTWYHIDHWYRYVVSIFKLEKMNNINNIEWYRGRLTVFNMNEVTSTRHIYAFNINNELINAERLNINNRDIINVFGKNTWLDNYEDEYDDHVVSDNVRLARDIVRDLDL